MEDEEGGCMQDGEIKDVKLHTKMFGQFEMSYRGNVFTETRNRTQFLMLMQVLLHFSETGVEKEFLKRVLFAEKEVEDQEHALHSIMYNAKKRLSDFGVETEKCISFRKGKYQWTEEIPVEEDTELFECYYKMSTEEADKEKKMWILLRAVHLYTGTFLENYQNIKWVAKEAARYREMFAECMNELQELLIQREDYKRLELLGEYGVKVDPYHNWETLKLRAMICQNRLKEALAYYADTVEKYLTENGMRPSEELTKLIEKVEEQTKLPYEALDQIQKYIDEPEEEVYGAYFCNFQIFQNIYRNVVRSARRTKTPVQLMLCNIVDSNGNLKKNGEQLEKLSQRLSNAIGASIRKGDTYTRYNKSQFLILLVDAKREDCLGIQKRINSRFLTKKQKTKVNYYVNNALE